MNNPNKMKNETFSLLYILTGWGVSLVTVGSLFASLQWPGGHQILFAGLLLVIVACIWWLKVFLKLPFNAKLAADKDSGKEKAQWAHHLLLCFPIGLCSVIALCAGIALKLLQQPGASQVILTGALTLAFVAFWVPCCLTLYLKKLDEENIDKKN